MSDHAADDGCPLAYGVVLLDTLHVVTGDKDQLVRMLAEKITGPNCEACGGVEYTIVTLGSGIYIRCTTCGMPYSINVEKLHDDLSYIPYEEYPHDEIWQEILAEDKRKVLRREKDAALKKDRNKY